MPGNSKLMHSGVVFVFSVPIVMNELFPVSNQDLLLSADFGHRIFDVTHLFLIWQCEERRQSFGCN